jgi:hypothetical protein
LGGGGGWSTFFLGANFRRILNVNRKNLMLSFVGWFNLFEDFMNDCKVGVMKSMRYKIRIELGMTLKIISTLLDKFKDAIICTMRNPCRTW